MGQQDKLRIRYATRLTPFKMQQILTSLLLFFFSFCLAASLAGQPKLARCCSCVVLVKIHSSSRAQLNRCGGEGEGRGGGVSETIAATWQVILGRMRRARRRRPAGRFLQRPCGRLAATGLSLQYGLSSTEH